MIDTKDVITMKIPFPDIAANLAVFSHMYVCMQNGTEKKFVKCQTLKPYHLSSKKEPYRYIIEDTDPNRNPFRAKTILDCDKMFLIENVQIPQSLRAARDICQELYDDLVKFTTHKELAIEQLPTQPLLSLNYRMKPEVS